METKRRWKMRISSEDIDNVEDEVVTNMKACLQRMQQKVVVKSEVG
jgi:hypothetical protein